MRRTTSALLAAFAALGISAAADAQLVPEREFYGVNRPIPMRVDVPEGAAGEVEIHLLAPVSAEAVETASAEAGRVDLSTLFPVLWTRPNPTLLYAQLVVGGAKVGPAVVLSPMLTPRNAVAQGREISWSAEQGRIHSGLRAWTDRHVVFETTAGEMEFAMRPDQAPNTVLNLISLAEGGYYTDIIVHRIIPEFVIQFGDPTGFGSGGPGYQFDLERSTLPHDFGVISMARTADPDSNGSQVFVCLTRERTQALDGAYCAFGQLVRGDQAVLDIAGAELEDPRAGRPANPPVITGAHTVPAPPYGDGPAPLARPADTSGDNR
jgi:cyclophilin family peptidyl-prolyl cis-trans isomerase